MKEENLCKSCMFDTRNFLNLRKCILVKYPEIFAVYPLGNFDDDILFEKILILFSLFCWYNVE